MRFASHLDVVRLFQRACRRADLPVAITKGFSPRLKISVIKALKLGLESFTEEAVFYMQKRVEPRFFMDSLNSKLPEGVRILKIEEMV